MVKEFERDFFKKKPAQNRMFQAHDFLNSLEGHNEIHPQQDESAAPARSGHQNISELEN